jgi:hypothetical protein
VQARAVGAYELLLPELLEHVRQHEQEGYGQSQLRQWRLSDLAYQAVLGLGSFSYLLSCEWIYDWNMRGIGLVGKID